MSTLDLWRQAEQLLQQAEVLADSLQQAAHAHTTDRREWSVIQTQATALSKLAAQLAADIRRKRREI